MKKQRKICSVVFPLIVKNIQTNAMDNLASYNIIFNIHTQWSDPKINILMRANPLPLEQKDMSLQTTPTG